jgi:hypothetical protein
MGFLETGETDQNYIHEEIKRGCMFMGCLLQLTSEYFICVFRIWAYKGSNRTLYLPVLLEAFLALRDECGLNVFIKALRKDKKGYVNVYVKFYNLHSLWSIISISMMSSRGWNGRACSTYGEMLPICSWRTRLRKPLSGGVKGVNVAGAEVERVSYQNIWPTPANFVTIFRVPRGAIWVM